MRERLIAAPFFRLEENQGDEPRVNGVLLPLMPLASCPLRPLPKSHYEPSPVRFDGGDAYVPTEMSGIALKLGVLKALDPKPYWPEELVDKCEDFLNQVYGPIWGSIVEPLSTYEEAVLMSDMTKSAGYPYYFDCADKGDALRKRGNEISVSTARLLAGEPVEVVFALTLKDELRPVEKVREHKTRVFAGGPFHHLLASSVLYEKQNAALMRTVGDHPVTVGIQVPGPEMVRVVLSMDGGNNGDGGGWDQRMPIALARVVRNVRHRYLPDWCREAGFHLYDTVYAGVGAVAGRLYLMLHQKSGWKNTAHDNSLAMLCCIFVAFWLLTGRDPNFVFSNVAKVFTNGDDCLIKSMLPGVGIVQVAHELRSLGVVLEFVSELPQSCFGLTYLSHQLRLRWIRGLGDVVVVAGNYDKLRSSLNWVRPITGWSFEESVVAHLVGLRMALWPWQIDFEEVDERLTSYLASVVITPNMRAMLSGRLSEMQIARIHLRYESSTGGFLFCPFDFFTWYESLIGSSHVKENEDNSQYQSAMSQNRKPSLAQRKAQSQRDKARANNGPKSPSQSNGIGAPGRQRRRGGGMGVGPSPAMRGNQRMTSVASAYSTGQSSQPPRIIASHDSARIIHRELVSSVVGSTAFAVPTSFALNPGLAASFPWLATQAQSWETYRFSKLRYCYYTRTGSGTPGSCMLVPDYDALDGAPESEQIASSYEDVKEDVPWKDQCCELRPAAMFSMGPKKFIRTGAAPAGSDLKTYDAGQLFVCTVDGTAVNWGKLWVEYDVTFYTPQLPPAGSVGSSQMHLTTTAPTSAAFVGVAPVVQPGSASFATVSGNVITFLQGGKYLVAYLAAATTVTVVADAAVSVGSSIIGAQSQGNNGFYYVGNATGNFSATALVSMLPGGTITFDDTVVTGSAADLYIALVPASAV